MKTGTVGFADVVRDIRRLVRQNVTAAGTGGAVRDEYFRVDGEGFAVFYVPQRLVGAISDLISERMGGPPDESFAKISHTPPEAN